jgi:hypothetical protein
MPNNMEEIVRPFDVNGDVALPKQGPLSIPNVVPNVVLIAGGKGSGKILNGSQSITTTVYVVKYPKEKTQG